MDFLSDQNLKKYKFNAIPDDESQKNKDEKDSQLGKSKSRIGFRTTQTKPETISRGSGYELKEDLMSIEQLDSLALFMRNNQLNNSENYPFYNNYDSRNIGIHKAVLYKAILGGNQYNATNNGITQDQNLNLQNNIRPETFEEQLNRKMRYVAKSNANIEIPNSLDIIGSQKIQKHKTFNRLDDVEYENDIDYDDDQYIQDNEDNFVQSLIEPFTEDDFDLARINNKIFDDYCWYKKDFRMSQIDDPQLFNEKRQYYENKRIVKRQNKEHLIYFIRSEIIYNQISGLMPHKDNKEIAENIIKHGGDQLKQGDILSGHVLNTLYKIDVDRQIYKQDKLELMLENFGQIHLKNSEELFICGGRAHGIAQTGCMLVDFTLKKYMIRNTLNYARYDHILLQLDDVVYIIGGHGIYGETLLSCEKYNTKSQQVDMIESLQLPKNLLCGAVSQMNKCLYIAGSPLVIDNYIQLQKFEPYTNFWSVINIKIDYLPLKQPKQVKIALHDESMKKSQLYVFCQDLNKYENYCISVQDLTGDDLKTTSKVVRRDSVNKSKNEISVNNMSKVDTIQTQTNFLSQMKMNKSKYPDKNQPNNMLIDDQIDTLDLSAILTPLKTEKSSRFQNQKPANQKSQYSKSQNQKSQFQRPQIILEDPKLEPIRYVPQFNEQYKQIFKNRQKYIDSLKRRQEQEKKMMLESIVGDTEIDDETEQSIQITLTVPQIPILNTPKSFKDAVSTPRVRSNSKLILTPQNKNSNQNLNLSKSIFFEGQLDSVISRSNLSNTPKRSSMRKSFLTKKEKNILQQYEQQSKLQVQQKEEQIKRGQVVRIELTRSDFNELEILASRDLEVYTMNKTNPLDIEKFDFISWQKQKLLLRFSPIL